MVNVTGVLSALKHPDPLADMHILSVPLTLTVSRNDYFKKKNQELNLKKQTKKTRGFKVKFANPVCLHLYIRLLRVSDVYTLTLTYLG